MTVVLDTSALLYWTLDPAKLSPAAEKAIHRANRIVISSISIWEIGIKVENGRLKIPVTIDDYARRLGRLRDFEAMPVDVDTWLENLSLQWAHRDPADRTIVATAMLLNAPLITSDREIEAFYARTIW